MNKNTYSTIDLSALRRAQMGVTMDISQLLKIVKHAYNTVPFYRELKKQMKTVNSEISGIEEFKNLPFVDKDMVQKNHELLLSDDYLTYPNNSRLSIRRTSGSTGKYLRIYWDYKYNIKSLLELWYCRKKFYNIHPHDKYCYFYTTDYRANKLIDEPEMIIAGDKKSIGFSKNDLNEEKLLKIYNSMYEFNPIYIMIQPSMAILLMECMERNNKPCFVDLRYIELTGEMLINSVRDKLEIFFGCPVCNQYGCNEANSIACEHGDRNLYVNTSNVYVEIVKDGKCVSEGEYGDIYITSLTNYAMPFIRYKIGDQGKLIYKDNKQILELVTGRTAYFVIDREKNRLPSYIFLRPIEHINEQIGVVIYQFQVVQNDIDDFEVYLSLAPTYAGWKKTIEELFISNIKQETIKTANWKFTYKERLYPDNVTGKLTYFFSKIGGIYGY